MRKTHLFILSTSFLTGLYLALHEAHWFWIGYLILFLLLFYREKFLKILALASLCGGIFYGHLSLKGQNELSFLTGEIFGEVLRVEPYFNEYKILFRLTSGEQILLKSRLKLEPGAKCVLEVQTKRGSEWLNPFRPDLKELLLALGVEGIYELKQVEKVTCRQAEASLEGLRYQLFNFAESLRGVSQGLFLALVLGVETQLPPEYLEALKKQGIYHQLAISGYNLALIYGFLYFFWRNLLSFTPLRRIGFPLQMYALVLALPGALVVLFLSGMAGSAIRAFFFLLTLILAKIFWRQTPSLLLLLLAGLILSLLDPQILKNLSFQFSFLATIGLLLGHSLWHKFGLIPEKLFLPKPNQLPFLAKVFNFILESLFLSFFITLLLLPLFLYRIGYIAFGTPFNNLLATFFWSFIFIPFSLLSAFLYFLNEDLAKLLMELVGWIFSWYLKIPFWDRIYSLSLPVNLFLIALALSLFLAFLWQRFYTKIWESFLVFLLSFVFIYQIFSFFHQKTNYLIVFKDYKFPHILVKDRGNFLLILNHSHDTFPVLKTLYLPIYQKIGLSELHLILNFSNFNVYDLLKKDFNVYRSYTLEEIKYLDLSFLHQGNFELIEIGDGSYLLEFNGLSIGLFTGRKYLKDLPVSFELELGNPKDGGSFDGALKLPEKLRKEALLIFPKDTYALLCKEQERRTSFFTYFLFPIVPYYLQNGFCQRVDYHLSNS